ncbi:M14 family zinc carboxypeptidase [Azonexus fungiphilus]|uniref:M14 family zinc carboxypeptidase n=1 Tax=Azonexus fungiphilus TaxID=146940 RepID=UPI00156BDA41|nr:M14 family zinc carboxypeptidase [Azonexus fungiphilus]NHC08186.1 murein peptide amidase A [Azonexus fungiphilus]
MLRPLACLLATLCLAPAAHAGDPTTDAWCAALGHRLRSVNADNCRAQAFVAGAERTEGKRALVWRDIAPRTKPLAQAPRVLVIGGIHGDELTSVSIVFRWLDWIGEAEAGKYRWRVIPLANPDGLYQRPPTRANARGVDLNRNFPTPDWNSDAHKYWIERTKRDPRRYPGDAAGSEIETQWLEKQIDDFKPDVIISVHAPYNLLDYDGPAPQPLRFGRLALNRLGVYPGSLGNYGGHYKSVPVVTIELPHASAMPPARDQRAMWDDMLGWMGRNIKAGEKH